MNRRFYSQHGEDYLAWKLLEDRESPGFFVEIGALDGRRFSNTLVFEEAGWNGLCIEAHPDYYPMVERSRPGSTCIHAACCDRDGQSITFHANSRGALSAIEPYDEQWIRQRFDDFFDGFEQVEVPARTLSSMLDEVGSPGQPDVVSIDVEGNEMMVLRGIDFERHQPRLIIVEAQGNQERDAITGYLAPHGYRVAREVSSNLFMVRRCRDARRLRRQTIDTPLVHTAHPHDDGAEESVVWPSVNRPAGALGRGGDLAKRAVRKAARIAQSIASSTVPVADKAQVIESNSTVAGSTSDERGDVFDVGFHGDAYLLELIDRLIPQVELFIETGANLGTTTRYVADRFPNVEVRACEPDEAAATKARKLVAGLANARIQCEPSPEFLHSLYAEHLEMSALGTFYFLDAHGHGFEWPLAGELAYLSRFDRGMVLVDDCKVPGKPQFKHSAYAGQECSIEYIARALQPGHDYDVVVPDYTDRTSAHHPLIGYALIAFGTPALRLAVAGDARFKLTTIQSTVATEAAA